MNISQNKTEITIRNLEKFQAIASSSKPFPKLKQHSSDNAAIGNKNSTVPPKEPVCLPEIKEKVNKQKQEEPVTNSNSNNNQAHFNLIHSRNLQLLKKYADKLESQKQILNRANENKTEPTERLNKIKQYFNTNLPPEIKVKEKKTNDILYYNIHPGNNRALILRCMTHRLNWQEASSCTPANLIWQPTSTGIQFPHLSANTKQTVNHFEYHTLLSNKMNLLLNMMTYCENNNLDVFSFIPITVIIQYDSQTYLKQMEMFSYFYNNIQNYVSTDVTSMLRYVKKYKDVFFTNLNKTIGRTIVKVNPNHYVGRNLWVIKAVDLNRGRCIHVADSLEKIQLMIKKFYSGVEREFKDEEGETPKLVESKTKSRSLSPPKERASLKSVYSTAQKYRSSLILLQKYIERPLLYKGRKFDIRIWVLLTHKLELFAFKEGHLKASSEMFDINNIHSFIHLTNYSVQKYSKNFSKFEEGNEICFADFQQILKDEGRSETVEEIFTRVCSVIKITMLSVKDRINLINRKQCYEIFGYDFILDYDLNPTVLEVNTNPGLEESSPLIKMILPRMIDDAFKLTIDEIYPTAFQGDTGNRSPFSVKGYDDGENMWRYLTNLKEK